MMKLSLIILMFISFYISVVQSLRSSKAIEGYSIGYLGDCPGSTKPAMITRRNMKYMAFTVQGPAKSKRLPRRVSYSYNAIRDLAKDPDINFKRKTLLYVGDYLSSPKLPQKIGSIYVNLGYNVLQFDLNPFSTVDYPISSRLMRPVGLHAAEMLANLTNEGFDPKTLEVVGFGLGGHAMGFIAKSFRTITGQNIATLIGLDPTGPCFRRRSPEDRLDKSDADFVVVVHTNMDGIGLAPSIGHIDFYINGGEYQAGDRVWALCGMVCSHVKSISIWLAALTYPNSFIAIQCESVSQARNRGCYGKVPLVTNVLGNNINRENQGVFYLNSHNQYPYFMKEKGIEKKHDFFMSLLKKFNDKDVIYY